ncbi:MAG TPA: glycosyltransferase family 1 protein [Beijerinckiaceae bacterium]|jgi:glycosyltransferase involved in cell wall biosynthesis
MPERLPSRAPAFEVASPSEIAAPLLVVYSHLRWDFVWQRPQHLLSRAAKHYRVLQIEEPMFKPGIQPAMEVTSRPGGIRIAVPMLPEGLSHDAVIRAQADLVERLLDREPDTSRVFWYYTPMAMAFSGHLDADLVIYDNMDELSLFRGANQELLDLEAELFERADVVFTGGMSLYEAKRNRHRNVHGFPSSIEFDHFVKARSLKGQDPSDQAGIAGPRLGFFGVVDERMDIALLGEVAALRPEWQFVMIGPVVKIDPATLPKAANIHWLGGKTYQELPRYLAGWDIGFMNFALNEATKFISPTKTPEFLAAGVPVVSTPITDVVRPYGEKGLVEIAKTPLEVVRKVEGLLARSAEEREAWLAKVDRHLAAGSWDKTWASMHRLMLDAMGEDSNLERTVPAAYATPAE